MLRDIDHSLPAAQRTLFRVLAREAGKVGTLFLIILYVNCYCGMVGYSLASGHGAVHWRGRPDRIRRRPRGDHSCEIANQAENERQAGQSTQDRTRPAASVR